jgi:hypothetical protein
VNILPINVLVDAIAQGLFNLLNLFRN